MLSAGAMIEHEWMKFKPGSRHQCQRQSGRGRPKGTPSESAFRCAGSLHSNSGQAAVSGILRDSTLSQSFIDIEQVAVNLCPT